MGNIYVCDDNDYIRKINTSGIIITIAGNGSTGYTGDGGLATAAELNGPLDVAVDKQGNVYIADFDNNVVRKVNTHDTITTIAGDGTPTFSGDGGPATAAAMNGPISVAVDDSGNIFIADFSNNRIRKINTHGIINTVAGNGTGGHTGDGGAATAAELYNPYGVAIDGKGNIYIADENNNIVRKVSSAGIITTIAGNGSVGFAGDGGPATAALFYSPVAVSVCNTTGTVYIDDNFNNRIRALTTVTGIDEVTPNNNVRVYPNPSNGVFNFQALSNSQKPCFPTITLLNQSFFRVEP